MKCNLCTRTLRWDERLAQATFSVEVSPGVSEIQNAWGCPDCGARDWASHNDQWACRGCGAVWSTRRADGDLVYLIDKDGAKLWRDPARITDVLDDPDLGRWCAVEGTAARFPEERLEPVIEEEEMQSVDG